MKQLLRIGELAKLGRVSVKAIRFYETERLLIPAYVDPSSGYRYYQIEQCARLALITNLRAASFTIREIASVIDADLDSETVRQIVDVRRHSLLKDRADINEKLDVLEALSRSLLSDLDDPLSAVKLDAVPPQRVHSISATVPHLGDPITEMFESAESTVSKFGARSLTAPFLIFHDPPSQSENLSIEVCIPLIDNCSDQVPSVVIDGCELACCVVYAGSYSQTAALRERIVTWVDDVGLVPIGPLREVYHKFGADQLDYQLPAAVTTTTTNEFVTELQLPIAKSETTMQ